ncbi:MAG: LamG-like jellyroll fold domain-containing protein [Calditrichia bacterium]
MPMKALYKGSILFIVLFLVSVLSTPLSAQMPGSGNALDFDGTNDYVAMGSAANLQITGDLTIECWVYINQYPGSPAVYSLATYGDNGEGEATNQIYRFQINSSGNLGLVWEYGSGLNNDVVINSTRNLATGQWHHVAVVRDATSSLVRFYINGVLEADKIYTNAPTGGSSGVAVLGGGFSSSSTAPSGVPQTGGFLAGRLDEVRIWRTVRTAEQIRDNICATFTGTETLLEGYWRMDQSSGTSLPDYSGNNYDGTLMNMEDADWVPSGAAIGDASTYSYAGPTNLSLSHSDGDYMEVSTINGTPDGFHLYLVDEGPAITTPPSGYTKLDELRYWGMFVVGGASPTFTAIYHYNGHPGITTEGDLRLASRANNSDVIWADAGITPNTTDNTLTVTGQPGPQRQVILGTVGNDNSLPVQLSSFTARQVQGSVVLKWVTESEIENQGFELWRSVDDAENFQLVSDFQTDDQLQGAGTTNQKHTYSFRDENVQPETKYFYKLVDVSYSGVKSSNGIISIQVKAQDQNESQIAESIILHQNYPNPFNPTTRISFTLNHDQVQPVRLDVYDLLGSKIRTLVSKNLASGEYSFNWDGTNDQGKVVPSGVYLYQITAPSFTQAKKMVFMR